MGSSDVDLFKNLVGKTYKDQAVWFLNAFWVKDLNLAQNSKVCEEIWNYCHLCIDLDPNKDAGNELDEFNAHRLFEKLDKALTVKDMRDQFRKLTANESEALVFNKKVSLIEFLIYMYKVDWKYLVKAPQASHEDIEALQKAENKVINAQKAVETCKENQKIALQREIEQKKAENEVKKALEEIQKEEQAFEKQKKDLETTGNNDSLGIVKRNRAKAELAQLLASDPLPLKTAKIQSESAVRRQEKATRAAVSARQVAEKSVDEATKQLQEASDMLEDIKNTASAGLGKVWWMERMMEESKKFMSKKQLQKLHEKQLSAGSEDN